MIMMNKEFFEEFEQTISKRKRSKRSGSSSSSEDREIPSHTTFRSEDEDMANCLILLANGGSSKMATNDISNEKVEIYLYECKTCNRSFPSFQALGGHRASHNRLKPSTDIVHQKKSAPSQEHHQEVNATMVFSQLKPNKTSHQTKVKAHECSICGSEFASGQALGGHMRRHRSDISANNSKRIGTGNENDSSSVSTEKVSSMLPLDLNLPAPPEDSHFRQYLVFSAGVSLVAHH